MLTSFGARTITLRISRVADRAQDLLVGQRRGLQVGLGDVGRDLQPGPDLALHLDDAGHRLLDQQRGVGRRPAGLGDRRLVAQPLPHLLGGVRRDQAQHDRDRLGCLAHGRVGGTGPESIALRVALTSSITRATTTLKRWAPAAGSRRDRLVRDLAQRRVTAVGSASGLAVTSPVSRQARCRNRSDPRRRHVGPVDVVLGRAGEHHRQPHRVDAELADLLAQVDAVAQRLAHALALVDAPRPGSSGR